MGTDQALPHRLGLADVEFLHWMRMCCLFRDNLQANLLELGADEADAFFLPRSDAVKAGDLIGFLTQLMANPDLTERFLSYWWDKYVEIKNRTANPGMAQA